MSMPHGCPCGRPDSRTGDWESRRSIGTSVAAAEAEIHAAAHEVALDRDAVARGNTAIEAAIHVAEIHMEIFRLGGPIVGQRKLDTAARRPAGIGLGRSPQPRRAGPEVPA